MAKIEKFSWTNEDNNEIERTILLNEGWTEEEIDTGCVVAYSMYLNGVNVIQRADDLAKHPDDAAAAEYYSRCKNVGMINVPEELRKYLPTTEYYPDTSDNRMRFGKAIAALMSA